MSARNYTATFGAGETKRFPAGRYFYILSASSSLNVVTEGAARGSPVQLDGIGAGSRFGPVEADNAWKYLVVTSPAAQTVVITVSDDGEFEVAASVTVAGVAAVSEQPASTITNTAPVDANSGAETTLIAANASRRRVQITADPLNTEGTTTATKGGLIRATTGGNAIDDLQPGVSKWFNYTGALFVRNDSGGTNRFYVREEL